MAKKEALSHFQTRLADRLQSMSGSDGVAANWLAVEVAGSGFVLPLGQSGEIFPWIEPHPVPYAKDWFLGVANLRGALCGVVNLSKYLGLQPIDGSLEASKMALQDRRLVGFHPSFELNTVLVVDRLAGLKSRHQMVATGVTNEYKDADGMSWREIDLGLLAQDSEFVNIAQ